MQAKRGNCKLIKSWKASKDPPNTFSQPVSKNSVRQPSQRFNSNCRPRLMVCIRCRNAAPKFGRTIACKAHIEERYYVVVKGRRFLDYSACRRDSGVIHNSRPEVDKQVRRPI